jgi:hypothetical protein
VLVGVPGHTQDAIKKNNVVKMEILIFLPVTALILDHFGCPSQQFTNAPDFKGMEIPASDPGQACKGQYTL